VRSLQGGLAAGGLEVIGRREMEQRLNRARGLVGCETSPCLKRVAELLAVENLFLAWVEVFGSSSVLRVEGYGKNGQRHHRVEERCDVCTVAELCDKASQLGLRLAQATAKRISSERDRVREGQAHPTGPGAQASAEPLPQAGGSASGTTASSQGRAQDAATPGAKTSPASSPEMAEETPSLNENQAQEAHARQGMTAKSPSESQGPLPAPRRISPLDRLRGVALWKWGAVGASLVALSIGASLVAIDGDGTCTPKAPGAACARLYNTAAGGWTLTTLGLVGLVGSGISLSFDFAPEMRHRARAFLAYVGRF